MRPELQKKIDYAIRLLRTMSEAYGDVIEIAYSGGKDSDVILQLAKEADPCEPIRMRAIHAFYSGSLIPKDEERLHYIGTTLLNDKKYALHFYVEQE